MVQQHAWRLPVALAVAIAAVAAVSAQGRAYQNESLDGLVARCTTVNTSTLPQASLELYGIRGSEGQGLLSCVVQRQPQDPGEPEEPRNVEATVRATFHSIGQAPEPIDIREVREENLVTYLGTYPVRGRDTLVFDVEVEVEDAALEMSFDDRTPHI